MEKGLDVNNQNGAKEPLADEEIDLLDLFLTLAREKKLILKVTGGTTVAALTISLLLTPQFTATTKILPPQQSQSTASAILGQVAGFAGGGLASGLGLKNPADMYISMLGSRTVEDALIKRFGLKEYYDVKYFEDARKQLDSNTNIKSGKDGIISIDVTDPDPKKAAEIANAYVDELDRLNGGLAITEASQRRVFYERQLKQANEKLVAAQTALKQAMETGGIDMPDAQGEAMVGTIAQLRAQISAQEIRVNSMASYAAENNPDLILAKQQLVVLQQQLKKMESGESGGAKQEKEVINLRGTQRLQDVKYYQTLYELLAKQYELARLDEAKDPVIIQVIDKAIVPEKKSKPKRSLIVLGGMVAGIFMSVMLAFLRDSFRKMRENPSRAKQLAELKAGILGKN